MGTQHGERHSSGCRLGVCCVCARRWVPVVLRCSTTGKRGIPRSMAVLVSHDCRRVVLRIGSVEIWRLLVFPDGIWDHVAPHFLVRVPVPVHCRHPEICPQYSFVHHEHIGCAFVLPHHPCVSPRPSHTLRG